MLFGIAPGSFQRQETQMMQSNNRDFGVIRKYLCSITINMAPGNLTCISVAINHNFVNQNLSKNNQLK